MKSNETSPEICFPRSVRKNTAPFNTPTRCNGSSGKSLRISRAISVTRFCNRVREIRMRRLSPFLLFRCDAFVAFFFFAMADPFRGTETLAYVAKFSKASATAPVITSNSCRRIADRRPSTVNATPSLPEPWLRGTLTDVNAVPRAVLHALELAREDLAKWCAPLTDTEFNAQPLGLPSIAFQLRHIARSIDRLLTYAEGNALSAEQLDALRQESQPGASPQSLFDELLL